MTALGSKNSERYFGVGYCPQMEKLELPPLTLGVSARVEKITQFSKGINFLDFLLIDRNCQ